MIPLLILCTATLHSPVYLSNTVVNLWILDDNQEPKDWEEWLAVATSLYPVYMLVGGVVAFWRPSTFAWFVKSGPNSYSAALSLIMLAMGFTLRIQDLFHVLTHQSIGVRKTTVHNLLKTRQLCSFSGCLTIYSYLNLHCLGRRVRSYINREANFHLSYNVAAI